MFVQCTQLHIIHDSVSTVTDHIWWAHNYNKLRRRKIRTGEEERKTAVVKTTATTNKQTPKGYWSLKLAKEKNRNGFLSFVIMEISHFFMIATVPSFFLSGVSYSWNKPISSNAYIECFTEIDNAHTVMISLNERNRFCDIYCEIMPISVSVSMQFCCCKMLNINQRIQQNVFFVPSSGPKERKINRSFLI